MEKITLCGDDCYSCPRYNAHTRQEQERVAELWYRTGMRDSIRPPRKWPVPAVPPTNPVHTAW